MIKHFFSTDTKMLIGIPADGSQDFLIEPSWVEVSAEDAAVLRDQYAPKPSRKEQLLQAISFKESLATPRRLRDAVITGDSSFLVALEEELETLRTELRSLGDTP